MYLQVCLDGRCDKTEWVNDVIAAQLHRAVEQGDIDVVRDLLSRRPEIVNQDQPDREELRALHTAVLHRKASMVRLLMEHGGDARAGIWPYRKDTRAIRLASDATRNGSGRLRRRSR